jgi:hypothetical protein
MPAATNVASEAIKFFTVVINLIVFIKQQHRAQFLSIPNLIKTLEEILVFISLSRLERCFFLLHLPPGDNPIVVNK